MSERAHQGKVAGTHWEPKQYLKFTDHRLRPALELLYRVPLASPGVIYDLGCELHHGLLQTTFVNIGHGAAFVLFAPFGNGKL